MKSTGYILNGVYYHDEPEIEKLKDTRAATDKLYEHDRGRENHRRDLIQPYTRAGKPNPDFISEYPAEAQEYGFIKGD